MTSPAALIGIDWGTTSFRAYRIGADGRVIDSKSAPLGILKVPAGAFEQVFERELGQWLPDRAELPVIASGMITSRQGWVEVPYCPCPAGRDEIARALLQHATGRGRIIHFVPGLSILGDDGVPDVIRGEETQIIGEVGAASGRRLLVLPGTHSKWALVEDGRIVWFATFMTGEVFGVLKDHSILGRLMAGDADDAPAFRRGLAYARGDGGGLLKRLFSARTLGLFDQLPAESVASYLSGLLIGTELREALDCLEQPPLDQEVTVIGSSDLSERYIRAIEGAGLRGRRAAADAGARGLFLIATAAGLVR
ncbi:MAG TPA: 2-dehydro-3-deoxygalactonokinase [Geminicoccaceae bacterium]